jgi:hypothetical protein
MQLLADYEPIKLKGNFTVEAIYSQGWSTFKRRDFGMQEVRKRQEEYVQAKLSVMHASHLAKIILQM